MGRQAHSWRVWAEQLRHDAHARRALTTRLAGAPFAAFFWEHPPTRGDDLEGEYTDIVLDSPSLARVRADPEPFSGHFTAGSDVVRFSNLGRDARLIVPCPRPQGPGYPHLAAFVRTAPAAQVEALWIAVAEELQQWWAQTDGPVWLSTAGLGVHWLHIRLDSRPKYYRHRPFRQPPGTAGT